MEYFIQHGKQFFLLGIFPFLGILFEKLLSAKTVLLILLGALILLSPYATAYRYTYYGVDMVLFLLILSSAYSFISRQIKKDIPKFITAFVSAAFLTFIFGLTHFLLTFTHSKMSERKLTIDGYEIECVEENIAFEDPLARYHLNKLCKIPILKKRLETVVDKKGYLSKCKINFEVNKIVVDKCSGTLTKVQ
jgi:hypothetical protein